MSKEEPFSMRSYDLKRYYDLLLVMREHYSEDNQLSVFVKLLGFLLTAHAALYGFIVVYSLLARSWLIFSAIVLLLILKVVKSNIENSKEHAFKEIYIKKAMDAEHSRADAIEYLYDLDWDDVQYEESHLDWIKNELNNAKNQ